MAGKLMSLASDLPQPAAEQALLSSGRLADSSMVKVTGKIATFLRHPAPELRKAALMPPMPHTKLHPRHLSP